ncbi:unnamed protein product [Schistocephalus solidus]|nr:unnamed protein product [Schistocephalus solidus]
MLPFLIITILVAVLYRKRLAKKVWIAGGSSTSPPDMMKLVDTAQPRYDL